MASAHRVAGSGKSVPRHFSAILEQALRRTTHRRHAELASARSACRSVRNVSAPSTWALTVDGVQEQGSGRSRCLPIARWSSVRSSTILRPTIRIAKSRPHAPIRSPMTWPWPWVSSRTRQDIAPAMSRTRALVVRGRWSRSVDCARRMNAPQASAVRRAVDWKSIGRQNQAPARQGRTRVFRQAPVGWSRAAASEPTRVSLKAHSAPAGGMVSMGPGKRRSSSRSIRPGAPDSTMAIDRQGASRWTTSATAVPVIVTAKASSRPSSTEPGPLLRHRARAPPDPAAIDHEVREPAERPFSRPYRRCSPPYTATLRLRSSTAMGFCRPT